MGQEQGQERKQGKSRPKSRMGQEQTQEQHSVKSKALSIGLAAQEMHAKRRDKSTAKTAIRSTGSRKRARSWNFGSLVAACRATSQAQSFLTPPACQEQGQERNPGKSRLKSRSQARARSRAARGQVGLNRTGRSREGSRARQPWLLTRHPEKKVWKTFQKSHQKPWVENS